MNAQNYTDLIAQIGVENLTASQKNFHNFIIEDINDGDFDDLMKENDYSQKVNDYIASIETITKKAAPEKPEKPQNPPRKTPKSPKKQNANSKKAKYSEGDYICWWDNDGSAIKEKIISVESKGNDIEYSVYSSKGGDYKYSEKYLNEQIKTKGIAINNMPPKMTQNMPAEFLHIKRYIKLNGVTTKKADLLKMIRSLQNAIAKKIIGKNSPYAEIIMEIQTNLVKAYNSMGSSIKIEIADEKIEKLQKIVGSEAIDKSVAIIKRFITWLNKQDKPTAAKILVDLNKNIDNSGKYQKELLVIQTVLNNFIAGKEVTLPEYELRGLAGIAGMDGLGFINQVLTSAAGFVVGRKVLNHLEKKQQQNDSGTVVNSQDIINQEFPTLNFTDEWFTLIGKPTKNFKILIYGPPKQGKSTLAIDLADYLARNFGTVLYVSAEEGINHTLQDKIKRMNAAHENLFFTDRILDDVSKYDFLFIDSIQRAKLQYESMTDLIKKYPQKGFVFVSQVTKDGYHRGSNEYLHEVDCVIKVEDGVATGYGRFSQGGSISINFGN